MAEPTCRCGGPMLPQVVDGRVIARRCGHCDLPCRKGRECRHCAAAMVRR